MEIGRDRDLHIPQNHHKQHASHLCIHTNENQKKKEWMQDSRKASESVENGIVLVITVTH